MVGEISAGKSAREMAWGRYALRFCVGLLALAALFYIQRQGASITNISAFFGCLAGLVSIDRGLGPLMDWLKSRENDAHQGAEAEENVGAVLNRLPSGWTVFHDVKAGFGNIDHLVLRQDGALFLIETKSHRGRVSEERGELKLNGRVPAKDFIRQTHANVFWLREFLKGRFQIEPWVNAALVFPNAFVGVRRTLRGVDVVSLDFLERWMARARGNQEVARKLVGQLPKLKSELRSTRRH